MSSEPLYKSYLRLTALYALAARLGITDVESEDVAALVNAILAHPDLVAKTDAVLESAGLDPLARRTLTPAQRLDSWCLTFRVALRSFPAIAPEESNSPTLSMKQVLDMATGRLPR
jgi:hypothetical protein